MEFEQDIPIKSNRRELDFLKRYLIMIWIPQLFSGMF
jgi:hypothetical protein